MHRSQLAILAFITAAFLFLAGCAPTVICSVETIVMPDYTCRRVTRMEAFPNPRFPQQRPRLGDYFQFPPAELYDTYVVQQDKVLFAAIFDSFEEIPNDMLRNTPGTNAKAGNLMSFRVMDLVLFVLADFDETLTDIVVSQEDGQAALNELLQLIVPEVMLVLNAKYGTKYDLSRLESWLKNDLPAKLRRLYAGAWAIHSAKRSGVTSPGEMFEYYMFLKAEAHREGLELADLGTPDLQQENIRRLKEYGTKLAEQLVTPRQGGSQSGKEMLASIGIDDLIASVQKAITARHGSVNAFIGKIAGIVPRAFGAYLTGTALPMYMVPETTYQYRLRLPGQVIQTNGVREINGDLIWSFADRDLAFTGQSMWARSIYIREHAVSALGLNGFPSTLGDVDRLFGLCLDSSGAPREELLKALRTSVTERGLGALQAIANNNSSPDAQSAKEILAMFERHRSNKSSSQGGVEQQAQPTNPAPSASTRQSPPPLPEPGPTSSVPDRAAPSSPKTAVSGALAGTNSDALAPVQVIEPDDTHSGSPSNNAGERTVLTTPALPPLTQ